MKHRTIIPFLSVIFLLLGCGPSAPQPTPTPQLTAVEKLGQTVFTRECAACHSLAPETIVVGPSLAGIATRASSRVNNQDASNYLLISILKPDDYLVDGFENLMPKTLGKTLTGEDLDAVVAYLLTLE